MRKKVFKVAGILFFALSAITCNKGDDPSAQHPVPYITVNRQINMDNALYAKLNTPGGYVYLEDEGYKGVIIIRDFADIFHAVDRACPFHPEVPCAKVTVEKSGFSIRCGSYSGDDFYACCTSKYGVEGSLQEGPSTFPLRAYHVQRSGSLLTVSSY